MSHLPAALSAPLAAPIIASPMFIASGPALVKAQCQSGIIGSFPSLNARPQEEFDQWLTDIEQSNAQFAADHPDRPVGPLAVNLIVHRTNNRLEADLGDVIQHKVPIVITSLGAREDVNQAVHAYGGVVLHDVINNRFAHKAIDKGADGLIAVAAGAGGHAGALSPFALVREIREWFDGPLALSGAIAQGNSVLAALAAGADFAYVGSAFLSTPEANVVDGYRDMIVASGANDIVYSNLFTGVLGNYLRGSIVAAGMDPDNLEQSDPSAMSFESEESGDASKPKPWKDIWGSGQGIGHITASRPTRELVASLVAEFHTAQDELKAKLAAFH